MTSPASVPVTLDRWARIREVRNMGNETFGVALMDRRWATVTEDAHLARGYAWGWQDARADGRSLDERLTIIDSGDAYEFSLEFAIHSARYVTEMAGSKTNVPNAYAKWRAGKTDQSEW